MSGIPTQDSVPRDLPGELPPPYNKHGSSSASRIGDHCANDPPLDPSVKSSGEIVKLAETDIYISKPSDLESQGTCLLLLLTNGVGVNSVANQLQADHFAREGYFVAMPDLFEGDPAPNATTVTSHVESQELLEQIKFKAAEGIKGFMIDMWLARHTPEKTMPIIEKVLAAIKEQYGDKNYTVSLGTYVVGYCFGGKYALRLAATDLIIAGAVAHGTLVSKEDITNIRKPVSFACVENDNFFPDDLREEGQKFLQENNIEHEMRVYEGVPHGFGVYGSYSEEHIKAAQKQVFQQFLDFMSKH